MTRMRSAGVIFFNSLGLVCSVSNHAASIVEGFDEQRTGEGAK
jgi:hypothetical protein